MRGRRVASVFWMAMLLLVLGPGSARAAEESNKIAARALGTDGVEAYQAGDYERATKQLEAAYAVLRVPSLGLWSARALAKVGKLVEASERYLEATRLPADSGRAEEVQVAAIEQAALERQELLDRIPTLTVKLEGAAQGEVSCQLDDLALPSEVLTRPVPVNPGRRRVVCSYQGQEQEQSATLAERAQETLVLTFGPAVSTSSSQRADATEPEDRAPKHGKTQRILGWTAVGVGAAGLAVGGVLAILAADKRSGLDCSGTVCNEPQSELDAYNALRVPSTVSLIAGGVLAAAGVTLLLTAPKPQNSASPGASLTAYVTGSSVGLRGQF